MPATIPSSITGIDLNKANIDIANSEKAGTNAGNVSFFVGDAQNLTQIESDSIDVLLNIESAFHYPDKVSFLSEVHRVLKPGGEFLIADILSTRKKREGIMKLWGKPMVHHFWNLKRYQQEFLKSELNLEQTDRYFPAGQKRMELIQELASENKNAKPSSRTLLSGYSM